MTEEARKRYELKTSRINAAIGLKEADCVPIHVAGYIYAAVQAGYNMAEITYDETLETTYKATEQYLLTYDPDVGMAGDNLAGEGRGMEILAPTFIDWAGRPGTKLDNNSLMQFLEFPVLEDDEFDWFFSDRTDWKLKKSLPLLSGLCKPLEKLQIPVSHGGHMKGLISSFSTPEMKEMIQKMWELDEFFKGMAKKKAALSARIAELGFPMMSGGRAAVPFDDYSDQLRGTLLSLTDLYEHADEVEAYINELQPLMIQQIKNQNKDGSRNGKFVFMALHKGLDGFMSDACYVKYYWRHLQEIIETIVDCGMVPYVFCEGRYSSRLEHLKDVPKGKVVYRFEDTPMELAKQVLGDVACITGGFDNTLLSFGTVQQVVDSCKKMLDDCAPGGGFIFQTKSSLVGNCKKENVEAMFRTVREYGKY